MTKKIQLLIGIALSFQLALTAQPDRVDLELGPPIDGDSFQDFRNFLGSGDDYFYTSGDKTRGFLLRQYSKEDFTMQYEVFIKTDPKRRISYIGYRIDNNKVWIYYKEFDKRERKKLLLVKEVDENGNLSDFKEVAKVETDKKARGAFYRGSSPDGSKLVLYSSPSEYETEDECIEMAVFDDSHELLWRNEFTLPFEWSQFFISKFKVSNEGDVYAMGKADNGYAKKYKQYRENWYLLKLTPDGEHEVIDLQVENDKIDDPDFRVDLPGGMIGVYGIYYANREYDNQDGLFVATATKEPFDLEERHFMEFGEELQQKLTKEDRLKDEPRDFFSFKLHSIRNNSKNNGVVIMLEKQHTYTVEWESGVTRAYESDYYTGDLIVMALDQSSDLFYSHVIPKIQLASSGTDTYTKSSTAMLTDAKGSVHVFFNDNFKNKRLHQGQASEPEPMEDVEEGVLVHYEIDPKGDTDYEVYKRNSDKFLPEVRSWKANEEKDKLLIVVETDKNTIQLGSLEP